MEEALQMHLEKSEIDLVNRTSEFSHYFAYDFKRLLHRALLSVRLLNYLMTGSKQPISK